MTLDDNGGATQTAKPAVVTPPAIADNTSRTADALYAAGKAANAAGDYETAYTAYKAAYDIIPTPDALLASGKALEQLAQETLNTDGPAS
jgi:tetratricopeptide (TPR) repeat protein